MLIKNPVETFKRNFHFTETGHGLVGMEREAFLLNRDGEIVPMAHIVMPKLQKSEFGDCFSHELSACQVEYHTPPSNIEDLSRLILERDELLRSVLGEEGFGVSYIPCAPENMSTAVYPDPEYKALVANLPISTLKSGCRVAATHFHYGLSDHETALRVYNYVVQEVGRLYEMADNVNGERMRLYRDMAGEVWKPKQYASWEDLYIDARDNGFEFALNRWWSLVRLTVHGTVEVRMFDTVESIDQVVEWACFFHSLCEEAL